MQHNFFKMVYFTILIAEKGHICPFTFKYFSYSSSVSLLYISLLLCFEPNIPLIGLSIKCPGPSLKIDMWRFDINWKDPDHFAASCFSFLVKILLLESGFCRYVIRISLLNFGNLEIWFDFCGSFVGCCL